ncbi:hypothetical protein V5O48_005148, partial [Marasmius crinis-equi]
MTSQHDGSTTRSNSPIPDDEQSSSRGILPSQEAHHNSRNNENFISDVPDESPIAGLTERARGKKPEHYYDSPAMPGTSRQTRVEYQPTAEAGDRKRSQSKSDEPASASRPASDARLTQTVDWRRGRRKTSFLVNQSTHTPRQSEVPSTPQHVNNNGKPRLNQLLDGLRTAAQSDYLTLGSKFSIEIAKLQLAYDEWIATVVSELVGISADTSSKTEVPSPLHKASTAPILTPDFDHMLAEANLSVRTAGDMSS